MALPTVGAGPSALGVGAAPSFLLDTYSATAAYSTRQLRTGQTNALRLRRDSDSAESDFGFDGNGDLDTSAISTWLGGASGYVVTWYDQSGNGNDATQATAGSQPAYVASGQNGKPVLSFDGVRSDSLVALEVLGNTAVGDVTIFTVYQSAETDAKARICGFGSRNVDSLSDIVHLNLAPDPSLRFDGAAITSHTLGHPVVYFLRTTLRSGNDFSEWFDGASALSSVSQATNAIVDDFYIGLVLDPVTADATEIIIYNSDQSANRSAIETDINDYWAIY